MSIGFIEKAFVMKIIQPDSNTWRWYFMSHAEPAQVKKCQEKPGFLRNRYSKSK